MTDFYAPYQAVVESNARVDEALRVMSDVQSTACYAMAYTRLTEADIPEGRIAGILSQIADNNKCTLEMLKKSMSLLKLNIDLMRKLLPNGQTELPTEENA